MDCSLLTSSGTMCTRPFAVSWSLCKSEALVGLRQVAMTSLVGEVARSWVVSSRPSPRFAPVISQTVVDMSIEGGPTHAGGC